MKRILALTIAILAISLPGKAEIGDKIELDGIGYEIVEYVDVTPNPPYEYPIRKNMVWASVCSINHIPDNGVITIPPTISINGDTYDVVILNESLFEGREDLKEFNMSSPKCVISAKAFKDCGDITLNISGIIVEVGAYAFYGTNVTNGLDLSKAITLGNFALYGTKTTTCTFGSWLWILAIHMFDESEITDLRFIENDCDYDIVLKFITRAFYNCKLKEVRLPHRYMGIPWGMFNSCPSLERIIFPDIEKLRPLGTNYPNFDGIEGYPYYEEQCKIHNCPNLKEIVCLSSDPVPFREYSTTEEICTDITLLDDFSTCVLKVPAGSEDAYRADPVWGRFKHIEGFQPGEYAGVESVSATQYADECMSLKVAVESDGLTQELPEGKIEIFNATGQKLHSAHHPGGTFHIDLPSGLYIIHLK